MSRALKKNPKSSPTSEDVRIRNTLDKARGQALKEKIYSMLTGPEGKVLSKKAALILLEWLNYTPKGKKK